MVRKPRKEKPEEAYQTYVFEITDWEPGYILSLNVGKYDDQLYWEHLSARISAKCIFPTKYAGLLAGFHLFTDRNMLNPEILKFEKEWKPLCVGSLRVEAAEMHYEAAIPHDLMPSLLAMLASEHSHHLLLHGTPIHRRKSLCRSFEIQRTVNLDDY